MNNRWYVTDYDGECWWINAQINHDERDIRIYIDGPPKFTDELLRKLNGEDKDSAARSSRPDGG